MSTLRTIHPVKHIDYSRDDRVDHLFVVGLGDDDEAILLTVSDTGVDFVMDHDDAGFSLTWAEIFAATLHLEDPIGHNGVVRLTTESVRTGHSNEQEQA
jgi:hypothetical protein